MSKLDQFKAWLQANVKLAPMRVIAIALTVGAAVIFALAYLYDWSGTTATAVGGAWAAFISIVTLLTVKRDPTR